MLLAAAVVRQARADMDIDGECDIQHSVRECASAFLDRLREYIADNPTPSASEMALVVFDEGEEWQDEDEETSLTPTTMR